MAKESNSNDSKNINFDEGSEVDSSPDIKTNNSKNNLNQIVGSVNLLQEFEESQLKRELPEIYVGDTVKVGVKITEGNKERVQPYEGVVIAKRHGGFNQTITVRRIFQGIGVERIFMLHSPQVASLKVERRGKVRRAKLFYLRDRVGKATRVKQRFDR